MPWPERDGYTNRDKSLELIAKAKEDAAQDERKDQKQTNPTVLQDWLLELSMREQTCVLTLLRGPDVAVTLGIKGYVRWIRAKVLKNAAPKEKFMRKTKLKSVQKIGEEDQAALDMLTVHFFAHLVNGFQIVGYLHQEGQVRAQALAVYYELCDYLHMQPESVNHMRERLKDSSRS